MAIRLEKLNRLAVCILALCCCLEGASDAYGQIPTESLVWDINTPISSSYPGQAIPLMITIQNMSNESEGVFFGPGGIAGFSMIILDSNGAPVSESIQIRPAGVSESGICRLAAGQIKRKSIVLNRWCSTMLSPGSYNVICDAEYWLLSEVYEHKLGPSHHVLLELNIEIIEMNETQRIQAIEELSEKAFRQNLSSRVEWEEKWLAIKMLALTESEAAIPHQVKLLRTAGSTWIKRDAINSLVKSQKADAALGLSKVVEQSPGRATDDIRYVAIDAVYALRQSGKAEIIAATNDFAAKHPRPVRRKLSD